MRRREVIISFGAMAASPFVAPLSAHAQQTERVRRVGVLMNTAAGEQEGQAGVAAFHQSLQQLGWAIGCNLQIDVRWGENNEDLDRKYAAELIALATSALDLSSRSLPIVFVRVSDPVGGGLVNSLARPGGNATGFMQFEYSFSGKWLELLEQIIPNLSQAAVLRDATNRAGIGEFAAIQSVASSLSVELHPVDTRDIGEIERALATIGRSPNS